MSKQLRKILGISILSLLAVTFYVLCAASIGIFAATILCGGTAIVTGLVVLAINLLMPQN